MKEQKMDHFDKALKWLSGKSYSDLKSIHEDHENPKSFNNKSTGEKIHADMSFRLSNGGKYFLEIALKTEEESALVTKWKLLSMMASVQRGKLFLLAPKGHKMFTQRLVDKHNINAVVYSA